MRLRPTALLATLVLAGCGGGEETTADAPAGEAASTPPGTIVAKDFAYAPAAYEASVGDTITLVNEDSAPHDIDSTSGPEVKTKVLNQGEKTTFTVEEAGTIDYICSIHPQMKGSITVTG